MCQGSPKRFGRDFGVSLGGSGVPREASGGLTWSEGGSWKRGFEGVLGEFWGFWWSPHLSRPRQVLEQLLVVLGTPKSGEPRRGALLVALTAGGGSGEPPCTLTGGWGVLGGSRVSSDPPDPPFSQWRPRDPSAVTSTPKRWGGVRDPQTPQRPPPKPLWDPLTPPGTPPPPQLL